MAKNDRHQQSSRRVFRSFQSVPNTDQGRIFGNDLNQNRTREVLEQQEEPGKDQILQVCPVFSSSLRFVHLFFRNIRKSDFGRICEADGFAHFIPSQNGLLR